MNRRSFFLAAAGVGLVPLMSPPRETIKVIYGKPAYDQRGDEYFELSQHRIDARGGFGVPEDVAERLRDVIAENNRRLIEYWSNIRE